MKYKNFLFIFVLAILLAVTAVSAEDNLENQLWVSVDGSGSGNSMDDPANMITVLDNVGPNFTVNFLDGTYEANTYQINQRNITLKAVNPGSVVFTGNNANGIFKVDGVGVVLDGFTFKNGNMTTYGGALFWQGSEGILKNCLFEDNYAFSGGAVYWQGADGIVDNCTFKENTARRAGAIHWTGPDSIVRNSIFEDNVADLSDGGAIYWSSANGVVENCQFINNKALANIGGAVYWSGINGTVINNTFRGNEDKSKYQLFNDGTIALKNNLFYKNNAIFNNGTINSHLKVVVLDNATKAVENNTNFTLMATITDDNLNRIGGKDLIFVVNNEEIKAPVDIDVIYRAVFEIKDNKTTVSAKYPYGTNVTVYGATLICGTLAGSDVLMYYKNGTRYVVYLTVTSGTVEITINNMSYECEIKNGRASLGLNLNPGTYVAVARYGNTTIENNVTILPTVETDNLVKFFKNNSQFIVKALDNHGEELANYRLEFNINGVMYYRTTNQSGMAKFDINLGPGDYIITTKGPNGCMVSNNVTVYSTLVDNKNIIMFFKNGTRYSVRVLDGQGNPLVGTTVSFNINGVFYNATTKEGGIASLAINLNPGIYVITAIYNGLMVSNEINVLGTIETDNLVMSIYDRLPFYATVFDGHGKLLQGAKLTFNINGIIYPRTTNQYGLAVLDINLGPGEYIITTFCNDLYVSNTIRILDD